MKIGVIGSGEVAKVLASGFLVKAAPAIVFRLLPPVAHGFVLRKTLRAAFSPHADLPDVRTFVMHPRWGRRPKAKPRRFSMVGMRTR